jgi:predicted dienelactone hydrolase
VTVVSNAFVGLGRAQARTLGFAQLPLAVIPHPFGSLAREDVRALAERCVADIAKLAAEK